MCVPCLSVPPLLVDDVLAQVRQNFGGKLLDRMSPGRVRRA